MKEIKKLCGQAKFEEMINKCSDGIDKYQDTKIEFLYYKAFALDNLNKSEESLTLIEQILAIKPDDEDAKRMKLRIEFDSLFNPKCRTVSSDLLDKLEAYAAELASDTVLISSINKVCSSSGHCLDMSQIALNYEKKLKEEELKRENDPDYIIDYDSINSLMADLNDQSKIEKLKCIELDAEVLCSKNLFENNEKFKNFFYFLSHLEKCTPEHEDKLNKICSIIGIKYDYLKSCFEMFNEHEEKENEDIVTKEIPFLDTYEPFEKAKYDKNSKSLGEILNELVLDMRVSESTLISLDQDSIDHFKNLEEENFNSALSLYKKKYSSRIEIINDYETVRNHYNVWEKRTASEIRNWAIQIKGNLTDEFEAIGIMDRANEIITGGHRLRHSQIVSLIVLARSSTEGKLLQINTGEGKTLIVSLFATIRVLKGETVDVITSNQVLAEEGARERKNFYNMLNLSVDTNNPIEYREKDNHKKNPYKADILYGCISNYQFDYLRDSFECMSTRAKRQFETVLIDEVDSMLIDNGGHIAKLSGPLPGMDSLRYVYIRIWIEINKEEKVYENGGKKEEFNDYTKKLKEKIGNMDDLIDNKLIPSHIVEYANSKLEKWIDNAIYAKYNCHVDKHYLIKKKNDEDVIVPIDYENTGVTLKNTIWSDGLHQFVQLKHNLKLTSESLTSSFISNIGYIKKYKQIYGLTGTLGSLPEQELLSSSYNVTFSKIPTYRPKRFNEIDLITVCEDYFSATVCSYAFEEIEKRRAVLIICETINDLKVLEIDLNKLKEIEPNIPFQIKTFPDEDSSEVSREVLNSYDILISTNIAGRGTDFKTSGEVEINGGLHVIVTYLPCNKRVEDQAFGRTSRQGNIGTAQIITIEDENFNFLEKGGDILKEIRDVIEKERINDIKNNKLKEIDYNDNLFSKFSDLYVELYEKHKNDIFYPYFLDDLKEFWAFWFDKKKTRDSAEVDFKQFELQASEILRGEIKHNPYYLVKQADSYIEDDYLDDALILLNKAIQIGNGAEILYPAYIKLFEISIKNGRQLTGRLVKALAEIIFIPYEKDEEYKVKGLDYLDKAEKTLENEIKYLNSLLESSDLGYVLLNVKHEDNTFLKHLMSRFNCLNAYLGNVKSLREEMNTKEGIAINKKVRNFLNTSENSNITQDEIKEIAFLGLNEIYSLKVVYDVSNDMIKASRGQIIGGLSALAIGIFFPPFMAFCGPIAGTLISEGISDIVMELISQGENEFDKKEYTKSKLISYGVSIATMGLSALSTSLRILRQAQKVCTSIAGKLLKYPKIRIIFEKMAEKFNKLINHLKSIKLEKVQLNRTQLFKKTTKDIAIETGRSVAGDVITEKLTKPLLKDILKGLRPKIEHDIRVSIKQDLGEYLKKCDIEKIYKATQNFQEGTLSEDVLEVVKDINLGVANSSKRSLIRNVSLLIDTIYKVEKIVNYTKKYTEKIKSEPDCLKESTENNEHEVEQLIEYITNVLTDKVFSFLEGLGVQYVRRFVQDKLVKKVFQSSKKYGNKQTMKNKPVSKKNNEEHENALRTLGLSHDATKTEITRAFRTKSLLCHPDKNGSKEMQQEINNARDILMQRFQKNNLSNNQNHSTLKQLVFFNSDENDCGQLAFAKMFGVNKHKLTQLTGVINTNKGSHVSDFEHQFRELGLVPVKKEISRISSDATEIVSFLNETNSKQAMLFIKRENDEKGHVFLVKHYNNKINIHDNDQLVTINHLSGYKGTLLSGQDLNLKFREIKKMIKTNQSAHRLMSKMYNTGAGTESIFGLKYFICDCPSRNLNDVFSNSDFSKKTAIDRFHNRKNYEYIEDKANKNKLIRFDVKNDEEILFDKNSKNEKITFHKNGKYIAKYRPHIENTHNWETLKSTEVILIKSKQKGMISAVNLESVFSLKSFIIGAGDKDIKVYLDSNPYSDTMNKINMITEGGRTIYRIDHNANKNLPAHKNIYLSDVQDQDLKVNDAVIFLHKNEKSWNLGIQEKSYNLNAGQLEVDKPVKRYEIESEVNRRNLNDHNFIYKSHTDNFRNDPINFLGHNIIFQNYPHQKHPELVYVIKAGKDKVIKFDLYPGNFYKGQSSCFIDFKQNGQFSAHYTPYKATTVDWESLKQTETTVKLVNPERKYVLTGEFSGCAYLIAVGKHDMKIYHDSAATTKVKEKYTGLLSDNENRKIVRIDDADKIEKIKEEKGPCKFLSYGDKEDLDKDKHMRKGHVILTYEKSEWYITINSYFAVEAPFNQNIPITKYTIKLKDLHELSTINEIYFII